MQASNCVVTAGLWLMAEQGRCARPVLFIACTYCIDTARIPEYATNPPMLCKQPCHILVICSFTTQTAELCVAQSKSRKGSGSTLVRVEASNQKPSVF